MREKQRFELWFCRDTEIVRRIILSDWPIVTYNGLMRLGIDFGTTRTVVAVADRGNYPVAGFHGDAGDSRQWLPSVVAANGRELAYAWDAESRQGTEGWSFRRSMKRLFSSAGPNTPIQIGELEIPAIDLLTGYLTHLRQWLFKKSNVELARGERLETWIAVPANANSNQRFLTLEAFRRAGFIILGMINEPSAGGIEYAHRYASQSGLTKRESLVVYDLGGGTFDASVISMKERSHEVIGNEGIGELGGDDFDRILLEMALEEADQADVLSDNARYLLLEECRRQKEGLHPNTRKIAIDLGSALPDAGEVLVSASEFSRRCIPLISCTMETMDRAVLQSFNGSVDPWNEIAAVYLVGGASDLPVVTRLMREKYGRKVKRSPYPFAATAIGLAILADTQSGYSLKEQFTRHFGVWREADSGRQIIFDPIFAKGTRLPEPHALPLVRTRYYEPAHTVGHYRYLECSLVLEDGQPGGDLTPWDEIYFPLDPVLKDEQRWDLSRIHRSLGVQNQQIEERYECDSAGIIRVSISNLTAGYSRTYRLRR